MGKTRIELSCENFDHFFVKLLPQITSERRAELPLDISMKIFRRNESPKDNNKLGFVAKMFVLCKALRKRWFIVVEDDESGISVEKFIELREKSKKGFTGYDELSERIICEGTFVLADKELVEALSALNVASMSPMYNYLVKSKNSKIKNEVKEQKKGYSYLCRFLANYKHIEKRMLNDNSTMMPEWLVLIHLYANQGTEVVSSTIHKDVFKNAYHSSPAKIKKAFGVLQEKKYIDKIGERKGTKFKINPMGVSFVNGILDRYAMNF